MNCLIRKGSWLLFIFLQCSLRVAAQGGFDWYISNQGNDQQPGFSPSQPKRSLSAYNHSPASGGASAGPVKIGFRAGDVFEESFNPGFPVHAGTYFDRPGISRFAVLNGTRSFNNGWSQTAGTRNVYEQAIPLTGYTGYGINNVGAYSMVYVVEYDRSREAAAPVSAGKLLQFVRSLQECENTPGSFYEPITIDENPKRIYIHPSDSRSPNQHPAFRYEVSVRDRAINSTWQEGNYFEKLWVRGYGAGNGMIPAGGNSTFRNMIFGPGAGIHHLGLRNAVIDRSLFLPAAENTSSFAVVFYDAAGEGRRNTVSNTLFLDLPSPIYAHTSGASNYGSLVLNNVIAFRNRTGAANFLDLADTDSLEVSDCYVSGYQVAFSSGKAVSAQFRNNTALEVNTGMVLSAGARIIGVNNCFVKTASNGISRGISLGASARAVVSGNIFWLKDRQQNQQPSLGGIFIEHTGESQGSLMASGNIFIADLETTDYAYALSCVPAADSNGTDISGLRLRNNVYILLRGRDIFWYLSRPGQPAGRRQNLSFEEWKLLSGQDGNSVFLDLRNDPRGLKAVFTDPDNGDFSLANTTEGNLVKRTRAGMTRPLSCFLQKPSYEAAVDMIMKGGVYTANACRNPCLQNSIRLAYEWTAEANDQGFADLSWELEDERNIEQYTLLRSSGTRDFTPVAVIQADGRGRYQYTDSQLLKGIRYRYSLGLTNRQQEKCYSAIRETTTAPGRVFALYPNPARDQVKLQMNGYAGTVNFTLRNLLGTVVHRQQLQVSYGVAPLISLQRIPAGLYLAEIVSEEGRSLEKLLIH